jgi:signal transduction histidine kinase
MIFRNYSLHILLRLAVLVALAGATPVLFSKGFSSLALLTSGLALGVAASLYRFYTRRFRLINNFFEAVKYRDFSQRYREEDKLTDLKSLYSGFNLVNQTVRSVKAERETHYLYLQKILELVDVGIMAFDTHSGNVLWMNEAFQETLGLPSFKNISFVEKRSVILYQQIFSAYYPQPAEVKYKVQESDVHLLVSNSLFKMENQASKLVVIQNIETALNRNEAEAWKKLLSVMTHEIMNSIAPIASLSGTLVRELNQPQAAPAGKVALAKEDLLLGLESIKNRSEGLMRFAKTYRSLNKVVNLNLEEVELSDLFSRLATLMKTTTTKAKLSFAVEPPTLKVTADAYLLEQVLINLILNALQATEELSTPEVKVAAAERPEGGIIIKVRDNGPGIAPEALDKIFVPFFTTKKTGSGIGLSLSKQIMTLHGGKIQLSSSATSGTLVSLIFPEIRN